MTTTKIPTLRDVLNTADPTDICDAERIALLGDALGSITRYARVAVVAGTGVGALPNNAKANPTTGVGNVFVTAGTTKGVMTFKGVVTTPTTGTYTVTPDGNLLFDFTDDAVTSVDIYYQPVQGDLVTETLTVASHAVTLSGGRAGSVLIAVTNQGGTAKTCDTIRGGSPSNGHAALSNDGTTVAINASDTSTSLTVTYITVPSVGTATKALYDRLSLSEDLF